ncbi:ARM repeat-containing protein [Peniophora sp. CONT]|nr:ARM repeat-containing protein [Peniophora sp. CONT]
MAIVEEVPEAEPTQNTASSSTSAESSASTKLPNELAYLISAFTPDHEESNRSKAFLVLASYCQGVRAAFPRKDGDEKNPATERLARVFAPIVARIAEPEEKEVLIGLSFLSALFQVDWEVASVLFSQESVLTTLPDVLDLYPTATVSKEAARLLSQAVGHKTCRAVLPKDCVEWLQTAMNRKDQSLRALAAMAIVKLTRGTKFDAAALPQGDVPDSSAADSELVALMKGLVLSGEKDSIPDAVEGLAYMCVEPEVKETLAADRQFLQQLFALVSRRKGASAATPGHSLLYGILMIMTTLCAYRPRLSAEDAQIQKLRRMAKAGKKPAEMGETDAESVLDDDEHAKKRCRAVVQAGGLDVLTSAVKTSDSEGVRLTVGQTLLYISEDKENRGRMLQAGATRALTDIIRKVLSDVPSSGAEPPEPPSTILLPIQALAKLAITASPVQVFGPSASPLLDSIRPLSILLQHSASTALQRFESMMALTNLSSYSEEAADYIAKAKGLLSKVEFLMLDEHTMIRRAATELLCNLMAGSEEVFTRYTGDGKSDSAKSRLHVLLALSDVEDLPTRLAASGALATLTVSPDACKSLYALEQEKHRTLRTFIQLLDPHLLDLLGVDEEEDTAEEVPPAESDPGLVHRGAVCVRNFLANLPAKDLEALIQQEETKILLQALKETLQENRENMDLLRPTAESLKCLMDAGMDIAA